MTFLSKGLAPIALRSAIISLALLPLAFLYFSRYCDDSLFTSDAADYFRRCRLQVFTHVS